MKKLLTTPVVSIILFVFLGTGVGIAAIFIGSSGAGSINLEKGLVGHWSLDGGVKDSTPYANHGTVTGADSTATDRKGTASKAYSFDGASDYVTVSDATALNPGTGSFTLASWVMLNSNTSGDQHVILSKGSQNLAVQSETLNSSPWTAVGSGGNTPTITANDAVAPDGTTTAEKIVFTGTTTKRWVQALGIDGTSRTFTVSGWAKKVSGVTNTADIKFGLRAAIGAGDTAATITLNSSNLTDNWQRFTATSTFDASTGGTDMALRVVKETTGASETAEILIWGVQVEESSGVGVYAQTVASTIDAKGYSLWVDDTTLKASIGISTKGFKVSSSQSLGTAAWHHVAVTYDRSGSATIYVDGVSTGTTSLLTLSGDDVTTADDLLIGLGGSTVSTINMLDGKIDDVRIYNRALSATEVTALYNSYNPSISVSTLEKGLVGHWALDGGAKDSTPYANHGTVTGATLTTDRKGQANKAYLFNGTTDFINMGDVSLLNFERTNSFSGSAWVKRTVNGVAQIIVGKTGAASPLRGWDIRFNANNTVGATLRNTNVGSHYIEVNTVATFTDSAWHYLAFTYNGTSLASGVLLYVDGALASSTVVTDLLDATIQSTNSVEIGRRGDGTGTPSYFTGSIDDVRIYNRALSATEITALYNSYNPSISVSTLEKGLVGHWSLDGGAKDSTPYANHGTVTGADPTATDRKGTASKAYSFNGTSNRISTAAFQGPQSGFTASAWIYPTATASETSLILSQYQGSTAYMQFIVDTDGLLAGRIHQVKDTQFIGRSTPAGVIADGNWYHVVYTWDGTTTSAGVKIYVNAVQVDSVDNQAGVFTAPNTSSIVFNIGTQNNSNSNTFAGSIDDVRVYNRALSPTEVLALYSSY